MIILGINAYHGDSSAALIKDGVLLAAVEEERFRRVKHWAGFPSLAVKYCLSVAKIEADEIDYIAINQNSKSNLIKRILYLINYRVTLQFFLKRLKIRRKRGDVLEEIKKIFPNAIIKAKVMNIEHHEAHIASAFLASEFENAISISVDGFGDFSSAAWAICSGCDIKMCDRVYFPHSLGIFYQALTQFLGFEKYGDEYKVMGLAPYGKPIFLEQMNQIVHLKENGKFELNLAYFKHHFEKIEFQWKDGSPSYGLLYSEELTKLLGPGRKINDPLDQRHMDIAASVQAMYEKSFFNLLNFLYDKYKIPFLTLAGGCAMNSVANGKIYQNTNFKKIYVQSAAGDAGGALGAALSVLSRIEKRRIKPIEHAYWGPEYSDHEIEAEIETERSLLIREGCTIERLNRIEMTQFVARAISMGGVVGWFQGRMEWGPRALGNRSILGDPRRSNMKDILNLKIKRRESFRPFAPSILAADVSEWFERVDQVPFMMQVYTIKDEKRKLIPAVTHVDGSGRLQTVTPINDIYYDLIIEFKRITGIPMVLNTSFNENEPIVCTPKEALNCFLRTKMDILVLGSRLIKRQKQLEMLD